MANAITNQRAREYDLPPQEESESDNAFRARIAAALRDKGLLIEAHEAMCDRLYDDPGKGLMDDPTVGITGAVAQVWLGVNYHVSGDKQVACDVVAGHVAKAPKPNTEMLLLALLMQAST